MATPQSEAIRRGETSICEEIRNVKKMKKFQVPKKLRSIVTSALVDYSMIKPGDKVLIGVSGGKDSLSLLHILMECRKKCPFDFEIACATVDPQVPEYQPQALIPYMESIGVKYHYLSQPIVELAKTAMTGKQSICAFCSRMKRGMLYRCMRENGYNVLALGQHLDDLVESFLMSCFRNGSLRTMKANYFVKEKDLRVIRPLIYVREKMTTDFANEAQLPIIRDNCPACFSAPKERHRIKMMLSNEEYQNNHLFASVLQAMKPLIGISSALSTKELIQGKAFPIGNIDEDDDQVAEETLLPCSDGVCPL
jgi:tRNA 2-thiocytidine biosynthesis protein TtcA